MGWSGLARDLAVQPYPSLVRAFNGVCALDSKHYLRIERLQSNVNTKVVYSISVRK
jgi:hypothetical protein